VKGILIIGIMEVFWGSTRFVVYYLEAYILSGGTCEAFQKMKHLHLPGFCSLKCLTCHWMSYLVHNGEDTRRAG
jgi:hypothetical protein